MKIRIDFVTNSSSTAYLIRNTSDNEKTIVDFVKENPEVLDIFNGLYDYGYTLKQLIESAQTLLDNANDKKLYIWKPGQQRLVGFGDEDGTIIGLVYDYGLRYGDKSESFEYEFFESWR